MEYNSAKKVIFIKITPVLLFFCPYSVEALSALTLDYNLGVNFVWPGDVIERAVGYIFDFVKTNKPILSSRLSYEMLNLVCLIYGHL